MPLSRGQYNEPFGWPTWLSQERQSARTFCAPVDLTPRLAILGIFSADEHIDHRREQRGWLHAAQDDSIIGRFILHGLDARAVVLEEGDAHGDMIFLRAPAMIARKVAPLQKLMHWLECASVAWPNTQLIGKADDDTYVHLQAAARHLRQSLLALPGREIYWGNIEVYHWHLRWHRPIAFGGRFGRLAPCVHRSAPATSRNKVLSHRELSNESIYPVSRVYPMRMSRREEADAGGRGDGGGGSGGDGRRGDAGGDGVIGPFPFARGALFFVSRSLAARVAAPASWAQHEAAATLLSTHELPAAEPTWPWEDVYLGMSLSHVARTPAAPDGPAIVHVGDAHFSNPWGGGFCMSPSTIVHHLRWKTNRTLGRISLAREWAEAHHCDPPWTMLCMRRNYTGCDGQMWTMCASVLRANASASCATTPIEVGGKRAGAACRDSRR